MNVSTLLDNGSSTLTRNSTIFLKKTHTNSSQQPSYCKLSQHSSHHLFLCLTDKDSISYFIGKPTPWSGDSLILFMSSMQTWALQILPCLLPFSWANTTHCPFLSQIAAIPVSIKSLPLIFKYIQGSPSYIKAVPQILHALLAIFFSKDLCILTISNFIAPTHSLPCSNLFPHPSTKIALTKINYDSKWLFQTHIWVAFDCWPFHLHQNLSSLCFHDSSGFPLFCDIFLSPL